MPLLAGIILGALLTIGAAFAYDSTTRTRPERLEPTAAGDIHLSSTGTS